MKTDIDRLHQIVLGERTGIRDYTFSKCHELLGLLETTSDKPIICFLRQITDLDTYLLDMLTDVFLCHGFYPASRSFVIADNSFQYNYWTTRFYVTVKGEYEKRSVIFEEKSTNPLDLHLDIALWGTDVYLVDFTDREIL